VSLFDTDESGAVVTAADRPSREVVCLLEGYGFKPDAVRQWTAVKANVVLADRRRQDAIVTRRADAVAREQEDSPAARGQPTGVERLEAAAAIEAAMKRGIDELHSTVSMTVYAMTDDELKQYAGLLVMTLRGKNQ
jgi:hypothetical protein